MKRYEKNLKRLQALTKNGSEPADLNEAELDEPSAYLLKSLGLAELIPAGDNEFWITLTDDGVTYFYDRQKERLDFIKNHFANFFTGFLSGLFVGVLAPWLIRLL
nr:MAG TPA: Ellis van Creveld protein 2 like protein [Caudoviricetes sp.]